MSSLSVNDWLKYTQPHHMTLDDLRNLDLGETLDVCIIGSFGWPSEVVEDNQPKSKASPLTYFKRQSYAKIRRFEPHHGIQELEYKSIDTERKPTDLFVESGDWHGKWIWIEIADQIFVPVEDWGITKASGWAAFAKRNAPDLVDVCFGQMPGKCRIGMNGHGVMIQMDDMERMPQIYRPDKRT